MGFIRFLGVCPNLYGLNTIQSGCNWQFGASILVLLFAVCIRGVVEMF